MNKPVSNALASQREAPGVDWMRSVSFSHVNVKVRSKAVVDGRFSVSRGARRLSPLGINRAFLLRYAPRGVHEHQFFCLSVSACVHASAVGCV